MANIDTITEDILRLPAPDWQLEILAERLAEDDKDDGPMLSWPDPRRQIERGG